jgi:hypothetical protein
VASFTATQKFTLKLSTTSMMTTTDLEQNEHERSVVLGNQSFDDLLSVEYEGGIRDTVGNAAGVKQDCR